jgi:hypothetical protein
MSITSAKNYQPLTASDRSEELLDHLYQKETQFLTQLAQKNLNDTQALTQNFLYGGGGDDPEAICRLCFSSKIML